MNDIEHPPKQIYNPYIYFCAIVACFAAVIIGYDTGFVGALVTLKEFSAEFSFDTKLASQVALEKANVISLFHAGAFFGSYAIYPVAVHFGRTIGFKLAGVLITIGLAIELIASGSRGLGPLYAGRIISGFGIGAVSNLAPMYVSEIAPHAIRGRLIGMYELSWQVGGVVGFFINYGVSLHMTGSGQWMTPLAIQMVPAGLFTIGVFFIPESPRWCFSQKDKPRALECLCRLRSLDANHDYIAYEVAAMEAEAAERHHHVKNEFLDPINILFTNKKLVLRLFQTMCLFMFQNATGINAINYYSVSLFETIGIDSTSATLLSTGIFGILKGVLCFVWAFAVVDRFGRKWPVLWFSLLASFSLWYIGCYIKIARPAETLHGTNDAASKSAMAFFYIWTIGYVFSWSGIPWVYMSEVFDSKVRNLAQCFNASANWFWAFILARWSQDMIDTMQYGIFFFFAALTVVFTSIYMLTYPETKNIPITDVELLFEDGVKPFKAHAYALLVLRQRELANVVGGSSDSFDKPNHNYLENVEKSV